MSTNTKIHLEENEKPFSILKGFLPTFKMTEVKHIYVNTFWITLVFAIALALFLFLNF